MKPPPPWLSDVEQDAHALSQPESQDTSRALLSLCELDLTKLNLPLSGRARLRAIARALNALADADAEDEISAQTAPFGMEAQRRQLTVLFCDLVGSTELSVRTDPEVVRQVFKKFEEVCARKIIKYGGYVFQRLGDAVVAYFGYPIAREDDAERAVRGALEIVESIPELLNAGEGPLQLRIGISTGLVVIADLRSDDRSAAGETMNLAARLQTLAQPGTIVVSDLTQRLVAGRFEFDDLGLHQLKGFPQPVHAWRVSKPNREGGRFEAMARHGLTPFVGRTRELEFLQRRWQAATQGNGQAVVISGEPGIGKSRTVREFRNRIAGDSPVVLRFHCSPFFTNTAFHPFIDYLERELSFAEEVPSDVRISRLKALMLDAYARPLEDFALIAMMLSLPLSEADQAPLMTGQRRKQATNHALIGLLATVSQERPVLLIFEDAHWADPSSLEVLHLLIGKLAELPVLLIVTQRSNVKLEFPANDRVSVLSISHLAKSHVSQLALSVAGRRIPHFLLEQIVSKTDGVPLYIEEFTKSLLESGSLSGGRDHLDGSGALATNIVPATLRDSLMARLDKINPVKEVVQIGAVLGRQFTYDMLCLIAPIPRNELDLGLRRATETGILFRRRFAQDVTYTFKHALIQDVAYDSLLRSDRQYMHAQIAQVLEDRFPTMRTLQPELLAHHYTEAGLGEQAVPLWHAAGKMAAQRSANLEAIAHLKKGLIVLESLPQSHSRQSQELLILILLGNALMVTQGYGAAEVGHTFDRARKICEQIGTTPDLFPVIGGLWLFYLVRGHIKTARSLSRQLLELGSRSGSSPVMIETRRELGMTLFFSGAFGRALKQLQQGAALYNPDQHRSHALQYGTDPGIACLCYGAASLWCLGYADKAMHQVQRGLELGLQSDHLFSRSFGMFFSAMLHQWRGEAIEARQEAELDIALCKQEGFVLWLAMAMIVRGWSLAQLGKRKDGLLEMQRGVAAYQATGAGLAQTYILSLLADGHRGIGQYDEGLKVVDNAILVGRRTGESVFEAELHRLRGQIILENALTSRKAAVQEIADATYDTAEACFVRASALARAQRAKFFELRSSMALAQLWSRRGRLKDAYKLLSGVYSAFTEGHTTRDMQNANRLLLALR